MKPGKKETTKSQKISKSTVEVEKKRPSSLQPEEGSVQKRQRSKTAKTNRREASPAKAETQKSRRDVSKSKSSKTAASKNGLPLAAEGLEKKLITASDRKAGKGDAVQLPEKSRKAQRKTPQPQKQQEPDKTAKQRKTQGDGDNKNLKRKTVKRKPTPTDPITEGQGEVGTTEEKGDADTRRKKAKKNPKKTDEVPEIKAEPDIPPKRKRKRPVGEETVTTNKRKRQKSITELKTKTTKTEGKSKTKKGVTAKGVAKEGGVGEGVVIKEEVNGNTLDKEKPTMAKEVASKTAKFVGAHMSISGGLENAVKGAVATGSRAFALFLRSQRQWGAKPLEDKPAEKFRQACREHGFPPHVILPHGSYLLNCGSPNEETLHKSREALVDELRRCEKLGLTRYNFHPGSSCGQITVEECLDKIGESINIVHQQTNKVMTVIENMSCQGSTVGGRFEELQGIIERVKDKSRIGVCLDTCHAFAAGFDLSSESGYQAMMDDFDQIVGLKYLVAVHLNDSKGKVGSHLDRHENIGKGKIGLKAFRRLMNDPRFDNIPLILETPCEDGMDYAKEIKLLNSLVGKS